jgi:hypothetical protein
LKKDEEPIGSSTPLDWRQAGPAGGGTKVSIKNQIKNGSFVRTVFVSDFAGRFFCLFDGP